MKKALVLLDADLKSKSYQYEFVANVHDEWQIEVDENHAEAVGAAAVAAIRNAGTYYNFKCPLDGQFVVGKNWADTH